MKTKIHQLWLLVPSATLGFTLVVVPAGSVGEVLLAFLKVL